MNKDTEVYLWDIQDNIALIMEFAADNKWDIKTRYAIERAMTIIGEAVRRLDDDTKTKLPTVSWNKIKELCNIIIHEYEVVNPLILKDICNQHLKPLQEAIQHYFNSKPK